MKLISALILEFFLKLELVKAFLFVNFKFLKLEVIKKTK
jgi:hypothetical protein